MVKFCFCCCCCCFWLQPRPLQQLSGQICHICGDDVGLTRDGELFVACNECAFPICRTCYEYERREGNQVCPQCKTRFKRLKGCARVAGDEDEDDIDDLENEFNLDAKTRQDMQHGLPADSMLYYGRANSESDFPHVLHSSMSPQPQVPLLTNGQMVIPILLICDFCFIFIVFSAGFNGFRGVGGGV